MATKHPKLIVEIKDGVAEVHVANWHGVSNTVMHGIEYKIERAIHSWRAGEMKKTRDEQMKAA